MVVHRVSGVTNTPLAEWQLLPTAAGEHTCPAGLADDGWLPATVPGTVAGSARSWSGADQPAALSALDHHDWWYRCAFSADVAPDAMTALRFDGLATVADVWLNGKPLLASDNMFISHCVDVSGVLRPGRRNELFIRFRALGPLLAKRYPRPRWRTRLVAEQNLRWFRTTLLGRIPAWSAGPVPVGPWRPVVLTVATHLTVVRVDLAAQFDAGVGLIDTAIETRTAPGRTVRAAWLQVGSASFPLTVSGDRLGGRFQLAAVQPWMPHTHGTPALYPAHVWIDLDNATQVEIDLGRIGFRTVAFAGDRSEFTLRVNDVDVFFRGGCWTPLDPLTLTAGRAGYRNALEQLRDAGGNMVRLCGPFSYEAEEFFTTCDELGIAVWHDFMFANMDYPLADPAFAQSVNREVDQVLGQLAPHPCVAVLCGNSEVQQQASMFGLAPAVWSSEWFDEILPKRCEQRLPGVPYWPSSPSGGPTPMHPGIGDAHYQGVGAYLRDFSDAETSGVRFASETLSFANVPEPRELERHVDPTELSVQSSWWKAGSPRDRGAGWDFDDIRDEYLRRLFGVNPLTVRYEDPQRYLAMARVTTGEVMRRVFGTWRSGVGRCRGGLIWYWRDLAPGAGWGVVDVQGAPKAAYYYLRRAWRPLAIFLLDRGLNGLRAYVVNDRPDVANLVLRISLYPRGAVTPLTSECELQVPANRTWSTAVDECAGGFRDLNHAYRFGPPGYDLVFAELIHPRRAGVAVADDIFYPAGLSYRDHADLGLAASTEPQGEGWAVTVSANRAAQAVRVDAPGYLPDDNYFDLAPGRPRRICLRPVSADRATVGTIDAVNSAAGTALVLDRKHKPPDSTSLRA